MRHFAVDESGTLTVLGLVMAALMIAFGGLAVDMMRYEATRASLQNTLDRSALAAASLTQAIAPAVIVNDYFEKAGIADQLVSVTATGGFNFRRVEALAEADTEPFFLNIIGLDQLHVTAAAAAEQRITNVEIMLVLDVSGSMGSNRKINNLRTAAIEFVNTVLVNDAENKISIGIVPFNAQVNLGSALRSQFNVTDLHGVANSNCVDLAATVFNQTAINTTQVISQAADADISSTSSTSNAYSTSNKSPSTSGKYCMPLANNAVRLPAQNIGTLTNNINGLSADGNTSINQGMLWGLTLLDPSLVPNFTNLIAGFQIPATLAGRPFAFQDPEALKVIVVMTDGENTTSRSMTNTFKSGPSPISQSDVDLNYSIFHISKVVNTNATTICDSRPYWVPHLSAWHSRPWNGTVPVTTDCYVSTAVTAGVTGRSWPEIWSAMRLQYVTWQFYGRALGGTQASWIDTFTDTINPAAMNTQLQSVCDVAKAEKVIVYGIAFEAPTNGQAQIRGCATSTAHYYDANGVQISTAFQSIARNLSQLRLTQ